MADSNRYMPTFADESELSPEWRQFLYLKRAFSRRRRRTAIKVGTDEEVRALVVQKGYTLEALASHYNTSKGNMYNFCRSWGIATLGMKERKRSDRSVLDVAPLLKGLGPTFVPEEPLVEPTLYLSPRLIPLYRKLAAHDITAWRALKKAGVEDLPHPQVPRPMPKPRGSERTSSPEWEPEAGRPQPPRSSAGP